MSNPYNQNDPALTALAQLKAHYQQQAAMAQLKAHYQQQAGLQNNAAQNAYGQSIAGIGGIYQQPMRQVTITDLEHNVQRLEAELQNAKYELERAVYKEAMKGPSPEDLDKFPSLRSIWAELRASMSLCGVKK